MLKSDLAKSCVITATFAVFLAGMAITWYAGSLKILIDPAVEKACYNEVKKRAPLGHRTIMTFGYREESSRLGIADGSLEAQFAPNKWTQVAWTCRINPSSKEVARVEMAPTTGGQRMKAAASAFK